MFETKDIKFPNFILHFLTHTETRWNFKFGGCAIFEDYDEFESKT